MLILMMFSTSAGDMGVTKVAAGGYCDWIQFVADVTIPDGVPMDPGFAFRKTWRIKNIGTCTWNRSYKLVFVGGEQMGGVAAMNLPREVAPGQTIDLTLGMTAPLSPGLYRGFWELQNPAGALFGMGQAANRPFFVEINVRSTAAPSYDFVANAAAANWRNEVTGKVFYPGLYGDPYGFVIPVDRPILENGIPSIGKGLLMAPPVEYHEHIYGVFPPYTVKQGDRFQAMVGCEYGAKECQVIFVLQYQEDGCCTRSFWNTWKSYKNAFTRVNLSLGPLAGKTVSFILLIRPDGEGIGDHAVWANPVIVNSLEPGPAVATVTPFPATEIPTPIGTLPSSYPSACDRATFMADVTVPDGTVFSPGQAFTKTWKFRNTGRCTWTTDYSIVFSTGDSMGAVTPVKLPTSVAPNQTIELSLNLTAPNAAGNYRGYFFFKNAAGNFFGIGLQGNRPFWLSISVPNTLPPTSANGYDFVAHACEAQWSGGAGPLGCPDISPTNGTIGIVNNPRLENNTVDSRPGLLTVPSTAYNGYIQGVYPPFAVQAGDHFKSIVNCEYNQRSCYVVFRLDYQIDNGPVQNLWAFGERYEGLYYQADIDLTPLAGQNVKFILGANANGSPYGDRAIWVAPGIVRSGGPVIFPTNTMTATLPPPTFTPTLTPTPVQPTATATPSPTFTATVPVSTGPLTYTNPTYGFQFTSPDGATLTVSQPNFAHINLPFAPGTNLSEKYLDVSVFEGVPSCVSPLGRGNPMVTSETITTANGLQFLKESGQEGVIGQFYDWIAYSIPKGTACISLNFVMHSTNPDKYPVPPPLYNRDAESAVLSDMISSFGWTTP